MKDKDRNATRTIANVGNFFLRHSSGRMVSTHMFALAIMMVFMLSAFFTKNFNEDKNDIQVFQLQSKVKMHPSHLDLINPDTEMKSTGFQGLDSAHRSGMFHSGAWIHVIDTSLADDVAKILLLKRGEKLVTCPNMWGLVGEHTYRDERSTETVRRAIFEELGDVYLHHLDAHGSMRNLTEYPVYYERDYGKPNGNRIDRQVTWVWLVEMNFNTTGSGRQQAENLLQLDEEVADHAWLKLADFESRVKSDVELNYFCHDTILSLLSMGIERIKMLRTK